MSYISALVTCLRPCVCRLVVGWGKTLEQFKAEVDHPTSVWNPKPLFLTRPAAALGGDRRHLGC